MPEVKQVSKINYECIQETIELPPNDSYLNTIENENRHIIATQLSLSLVHSIYENVWKISMENNCSPTSISNNYNEDNYHVTKNELTCNENCKPYSCCNICYHSYSCTCNDFLSKNIICEHIHLVVLYQETAQTYQYEDNIDGFIYNNTDHASYTQKCIESSSLSQPVENVCLREDITENNDYIPNKQNMISETLKGLKIRVEKLMLETLQRVNECNDCDLLENIEKQMIDIACNLSTELIQNEKSSNEIQTIDKNVEVYYVYWIIKYCQYVDNSVIGLIKLDIISHNLIIV